MPFLRFTRDTRGYESTFLMHAARRRGKSRQRVLYWFRTPPNVKVGRAALDEEAIRWIEEHNPDIVFDWPAILEVQPPASPPSTGVEPRRGRKTRVERPRPSPKTPVTPLTIEPLQPQSEVVERVVEQVIETESPEAAEASSREASSIDPRELEPAAIPPADALLGAEQGVRLRARFAELQARITERAGSVERVEALRARAEALNPDTWVTEDDIKKGLAIFDSELRDLRAALGLRRRRRSRRGGRRHRRGRGELSPPDTTAGEGAAGAEAAESGASAEESPNGLPDELEDEGPE